MSSEPAEAPSYVAADPQRQAVRSVGGEDLVPSLVELVRGTLEGADGG